MVEMTALSSRQGRAIATF